MNSLPFARRFLLAAATSALLALATVPMHAQDDPPDQAGRLSFLSGVVSLQTAGSDDWSQAQLNLPFAPGDRIFTDSDGRAEIQVGRVFLRMGPNTDLSFVDIDPRNLSFGLAQGSVHIRCLGLWPVAAFRRRAEWFPAQSMGRQGCASRAGLCPGTAFRQRAE